MVTKSCAGCGKPIQSTSPYAARIKWCSEKCRKAQYSQPCVVCGAPTNGSNGRGPKAAKRCQQCARLHTAQRERQQAHKRWHAVRRLREKGLLNYEIAEALGVTTASVANAIYRMRQQGWQIEPTPYSPITARDRGKFK